MSTGFDKSKVTAISLTPGSGEHEDDVASGESSTSRRLAVSGEVLVLYVICIAIALGLSALLVQVTGGSAGDVFNALLDGSFRKPGRIGLTIGVAIPLLLVALGTIISTKAGLVNIGQEGQLFLGAAFAAYVGTE